MATTKQIPYYERDVDFDDLAKRDPEFAKISQIGKKNGFINFQDPKIVQQLTKSLLKADFNLHLTLPDDRLCPPVPVRWNYIRWIQDLVDTTSSTYRESFDPERQVRGLDIGVGASCIYALLACAAREGWRMVGTDVDSKSLEWAGRNVEVNGLGGRVRLREVQRREGGLLVEMGEGEMDFVMTNPPFYSSEEEFCAAYSSSSSDLKDRNKKIPSAVTAGAENEMICPGGDVGFVLRILAESLELRERVQWYTAMLSKLSSLQQVIAKIKEAGVTNWAVTSLHPGHRTKRWAVGWSFGDLRPRNEVARHGELVLSVLPMATAQTVRGNGNGVDGVMRGLDVRWLWREAVEVGVMECKGNVWSRAARRKKRFEKQDGEEMDEGEEDSVALAVKISCKGKEEVEVRWLRGNDHVLFMSFCKMLERALNER